MENLQQKLEETKEQLNLGRSKEQVLYSKMENLQEDNNKLRTEIIHLNSLVKSETSHNDFQKNIENLIEKERQQFRVQLQFAEKKMEGLKKES